MSLELKNIARAFHAAVLGDGAAELAPLLTAAHGDLARRMNVYRNTVRGSLAGSLATAFPATARLAGRDFAALAERFVMAMPPRVPQLSAYGADFALFIHDDEVGRRLAYLSEVAQLEWARSESYFAADAPALDPARLAALSPDEMAATALKLHPATRLIVSACSIYRLWQGDAPANAGEAVLVTRKDDYLVTRALAPADAEMIGTIAAGKPLGEAAAAALGVDAAFDLQGALQTHFINATFRG